MLPEYVWNPETTFIDINCIDGSKLQAVYNRLDKKLSELPEYKDDQRRREHIVQNQLYGICLNDTNAFIVSRRIFGEPFSEKVTYINEYETFLLNGRYSALSQIMLQRLGISKFDVVLCQTPIVNSQDIFINYIDIARYLYKQYVLAVTPGKWAFRKWGKHNLKIEEFIKNNWKLMNKVVYFKENDVLRTRDKSGITMMSIQTIPAETIEITFHSKNKHLCSIETHSKKSVLLCQNVILDIAKKAKTIDKANKLMEWFNDPKVHAQYINNQAYCDTYKNGMLTIKQGEAIVGYANLDRLKQRKGIDKWKQVLAREYNQKMSYTGNIGAPYKFYTYSPNEIPSISYVCVNFFDTEKQCNSFSQFMNTKFVGLLEYVCTYNRTIQPETFRLVPNPNDWSVTYVDSPHPGVITDEKGYYTYNGERYCSLYVRYKLSKEDIDIIESIIKPRR